MTFDLAAFNAELDRETRDLPEREVRDRQRSIGLQALSGVIDKTPVDTGRAAGNWQIGISSPVIAEIDAIGPAGVYEREAPKLDTIPAFDVVYLNNNVEYASVLEDGGYPKNPKRGSYIKGSRRKKYLGVGKSDGSFDDANPGGVGVDGYIVLSRGGFSLQAPHGMVGVTLAELEQKFP